VQLIKQKRFIKKGNLQSLRHHNKTNKRSPFMKKVKKSQGKVYQHLQSYERDEIACMLSVEYSQKAIATVLSRNESTISNEI
jgi:DNA-binding NarL/FixJ family response regulator